MTDTLGFPHGFHKDEYAVDTRPYNYDTVVDGVLYHKRWVNSDGTLKTGIELEREKLRVELQCIARRLVAIEKETAALESNPDNHLCPHCGFHLVEWQEHGSYRCQNCKQVTMDCCDGPIP